MYIALLIPVSKCILELPNYVYAGDSHVDPRNYLFAEL